MNYIHLLYLLCSVTYVICAPTPAPTETTFYAALVEKCPVVGTSSEQDLALFQTCKDWKTISAVNNLTTENQKDIRCLLYFESFTHYCTSSQKPDILIPENVNLKYDLNTICNFTKNLQHKNLSKIFATEQNCKQICTDEFGWVQSICRISYYFANIKKDNANNEPSPQISVSQKNLENKKPVPQIPEKTPQNGGIVEPESQPQNSDTVPNQQLLQSVATKKGVGEDNKEVPRTKDTETENETRKNGIQKKPQETIEEPQDTQSNFNPPRVAPVDIDSVGAEPETANVQEEQTENAGSVHTATNLSADKNKLNHSPELKNNQQNENAPGGAAVPVDLKNRQVLQNQDVSKEKVAPVDTAKLPTIQGKTNEIDPGADQAPVSDNQDDKKKIAQDPVIDQMEEKTPEDFDGMDGDPEDEAPEPSLNGDQNEKPSKPSDTEPANYNSEMDGDSYFFTYFMLLCIVFIVGYVCYHNKQKILALILEGRRGKRQYRGRRPNSANYHKLDSNLEEAINSSCKKNPNNVIY